MAAFEAVSKIALRPIGADSNKSLVDIRLARLPSRRDDEDDDDESDFDPRDHRQPRSPIGPAMAYFNVLRSLFGAGMLGMPLAVSQAGIVVGPLLIIFASLLIVHMHLTLISLHSFITVFTEIRYLAHTFSNPLFATMLQLTPLPKTIFQLECLNEISRQLRIPHISYRYGFRIALLHGPPIFRCMGNRGPTIIATFMVLSQLGICTVFVTFTSDSLRDVSLAGAYLMLDWQSSAKALLVLILPYILLECYMTTLKIVSYVSMFGNLMNIAGLVLVFYHIFEDPQGDDLNISATGLLPLMFAFGTFLFNLSAIGVILSIDRALPNPRVLTKKFGVVTVGIFVPSTVSIILGTLGYWSFGTMEENILRSLPFDDPSSLAAMGLYLVAVALAFPIQCTPAIQIILEIIKNRKPEDMPSQKTLRIIEVIARPTFVVLTFVVSYLIPFQAPFVAFVGNLCTTVLALVFPAIMEVCLLYPSQFGKYNIYLIKDIAIMVIGLSSWIFGVIICIYMIYIRLVSMSSPNDT